MKNIQEKFTWEDEKVFEESRKNQKNEKNGDESCGFGFGTRLWVQIAVMVQKRLVFLSRENQKSEAMFGDLRAFPQ